MEEELKIRMKALVTKWKGNKPERNSDIWWRYRADQSLYIFLKSKLDSLNKKTKLKI